MPAKEIQIEDMCLSWHNHGMKTISIKQLHDATGKCVRAAHSTPLIVTDRGTKVALLKRFSPEDLPSTPFPARNPARLPSVIIDSTEIISSDRTER
jgi:hypothetical protein